MNKKIIIIIGFLITSVYASDHVIPSPIHKKIKKKTAQKGYTCQTCGFKGKWAGDSKRHERKHTKEKPYHCMFCPMRFTQSYDKTLHENRHKRDQRLAECYLLLGIGREKKKS